jgi:hypothetical protein
VPIVDKGTFETLKAAVKSPEDYSTGKERNKLQAAFDIAGSQITSHVFHFEAKNRTMLRRRLNGIKEHDIPEPYGPLIKALKKALASCEPLQSKSYSDDDEETIEFIDSDLSTLTECIEKLDDE